MAIEEEFGIEISDSEASHCVTMDDVYKLVADKLGVKYSCGVDKEQPKEKNMTALKREDLLNTKWDVSEWSLEMKTRWQHKLFELEIYWFSAPALKFKYRFLDASEYYIDQGGELQYSNSSQFYVGVGMKELFYTDIFREDSHEYSSATTGSGVHAESGSVNDTRKNIPDDTSALDTLRKVCQDHGLYMTLDPHGEVIVTEASSDVEYKVESEDQLQKLLSALEVLNGYAK